MKIICVDSTDPKNVTEVLIEEKFESEEAACAQRDDLRRRFEGKSTSLWFEVVSDDYALKAAPPSSPPPKPVTPIGNEPDGTPETQP